jgi:hypothetical protein
MNKQSIKVLLASGALAVAAMLGGCNNGTSETCECPNGKEYAYPDDCSCSGVDCNCIQVYSGNSNPNQNNVVFKLPSGTVFTGAEKSVIDEYVFDTNLTTHYGQKFAASGLIVVVKNGITTWEPGDIIGKIYIPRSSLSSEVSIDDAIGDYAFTLSFKQFDTSKETVRLAFGKQGNAGVELVRIQYVDLQQIRKGPSGFPV